MSAGESGLSAIELLIADEMPVEFEKTLLKEGISVANKPQITKEELISEIPKYHGLIVRSKTKVTKEIIDAASNLKVIGRPGTGLDNVDLEAANMKGIAVFNTPTSNKISVAELAIGYMISLSRSIIPYDNDTKNGGWSKGKMPGKRELYGKTLGIIGLGYIGEEVAKKAEAFGMNVIYHDPYKRVEKYQSVSIEKLFEEADFITVHVPSKEDTNSMINHGLLGRMKKNAAFINTSRAEVVERDALEKILEERQDLMAAADVFYDEKAGEKGLAKFKERVILTPHIGASTHDAQERGAQQLAELVLDCFKSGIPKFAVNMPRIDEGHFHYGKLSERIAYLGCNLLNMRPNKVEISCYGDLEKYTDFLMNVALIPIVKYQSDFQSVNAINSIRLAEGMNMQIIKRKPHTEGYGNSITLDLIVDRENSISIRGTIDDNRVKMMRIGDYNGLSVVAEGKPLMAMYDESYGILEAISHVLAKYQLSAVSMSSGEDKKTNREMAFLNLKTNSLLGEKQLDEIKYEFNKRRGTSIRENASLYQIKQLDFDNL
jgi:D-3-phosphoglycerate dehydrogenase